MGILLHVDYPAQAQDLVHVGSESVVLSPTAYDFPR